MAIQDVAKYCVDCNVMRELEEDENTIDNARYICSHCRSFGSGGIYKADAIYSALKYKKRADSYLRKGKRPVVVKRYGKAVYELTNQGKSLRDISKTLGISVNSVRKCRDEWQAKE